MAGSWQAASRSCPNCGGSLMRVARRPIDRLLSLVRPMHRYQCSALECGWQGNLSRRPPLRPEYLTPLTTTTRAH